MPPTQQATLTEIYKTLNQLVDAYTAVMMTFSSVVTEISEIRNEIADLREFNRGLLTDAVSASRVWQSAAEAHKEEVQRLTAQISAMERVN